MRFPRGESSMASSRLAALDWCESCGATTKADRAEHIEEIGAVRRAHFVGFGLESLDVAAHHHGDAGLQRFRDHEERDLFSEPPLRGDGDAISPLDLMAECAREFRGSRVLDG